MEEVTEKVQEETMYTELKDPYGFIYITTNLVNGKRYLGQKKFGKGSWVWKDYIGSGLWFKKAVEKYGQENFSRNIILICNSEEELNKAEYELSVLFNVVESDDWYNLVLGGGTSRGWHPSNETKKKISDAAKERLADPTNHPCYGKPGLSGIKNSQFGISPKERMDEESYARWYEKHKKYWENPAIKGQHIWADKPHPNLGKHMSDENKNKLRAMAKERYQEKENHPMFGHKHKEISKSKMSNSHKLSNIEKGITIYSVNFHKIFYGAVEVAKEFNIDQSHVTACCKGKQTYCGIDKNSGEKMVWVYTADAIKKGYLTQDEYDQYVYKIKNIVKGD